MIIYTVSVRSMPGLGKAYDRTEEAVTIDFDIEKMFREKRPDIARRIPRFGYALLRAVLRERRVRQILEAAGDRQGFDLVRYLLDAFDIRVRVKGALPQGNERWTIVSNHPTGGWDALAVFDWLADGSRDCVMLANDVLWSVEALRPVLFPVGVFAQSRERLTALSRLYEGHRTIVLFPAGRTSRPRNGVLEEYPWHASCVRKSRHSGRMLLPVHISGHNSKFFYRVWRMRERLGITKTIEMFLLVDEMLHRRGEEIVLTIGAPQDAGALSAAAGGDMQAAEHLRLMVQALGQEEAGL